MLMKKTFSLILPLVALLFVGCTTHYTLTDVSRTRILIDKRYDARPNAQAVAFLAPYKQKVDSIMGPVVGQVAHDMAAERPESDLSNLLPDILVHMAGRYGEKPDFGVYNMGGIRSAFSKGNVTFGDVLDVAPFENKICFITLTGEKVLELFGQMCHRGGECVSKGVSIVSSADGHLVSASLNGQPIDPKGSYRITTIDYLVQGNDGLVAFKSGTDLVSPQEDENNARFIITDFFREMTRKGIVVDSKVEGRFVVKSK